MPSIITLNAVSDFNQLQNNVGLFNTTVYANALRDWVRSSQFGGNFASNSIPSASLQIVQGNRIQTRSLSGSNFTGGQIARLSIQEQDLADNAVTTRNIVNGSVTNVKIESVDASKITSGTLADARIPNLNASKINAGTLDVARIPNLNASIINAGTFGVARIPNLNASIINDGVLPIARGGTGGGTQATARTGLGLGSLATLNSINYNNLPNIVTANRVLGSSTANSTISEVQINPSMLTTGAPSWDSSGNLTVSNFLTVTERITTKRVFLDSLVEKRVNLNIINGIVTLDLILGTVFVITNKNVAVSTIQFSNIPATNSVSSFILQIQAGGNTAITWPNTFKWSNGVQPNLSTTIGKTDTFGFFTYDGGSNWWGFVLGLNA